MRPVCTNRGTIGRWYQIVSTVIIPWWYALTIRGAQSATRTLSASTTSTDPQRPICEVGIGSPGPTSF